MNGNISEFNDPILAKMPHFISVSYQNMLTSHIPEDKLKWMLYIYKLGLRLFALISVSQYLILDRDKVSDPYFNELLLQKFPRLTLDACQHIFFHTLQVYEGRQDYLFFPEIYDFYWNTEALPHVKKPEIEMLFNRLTQITFESQRYNISEITNRLNDVTNLLEQFIEILKVFESYDLIRIIKSEKNSYSFELHKGLQIQTGHGVLSKEQNLQPKWFYFRKETENFLLLHPLLIFWQEQYSNKVAIEDIGLYDRFIYEKLQYLLVELGKTVESDNIIEFADLFYETLEKRKFIKQNVEKLTWSQLRDISHDITLKKTATVRSKYHQQLYLQREKVYQVFHKFLESEQKCFVLIGKSGVGKSNFVLDIANELHQTRNDICTLVYDGSSVAAELGITESISSDFSDRLIISGRHVQNIWRDIAKIERMDDRLFVLFIDAINENLHAKTLLRQLDEIVQKPWGWLKVVFSSRPETWQSIKHGVKLSEALYYRSKSDTIGIELEPFSYSERMEPFSRQELPAVYLKYQNLFELKTPYEKLEKNIRELLSDPLNLWIVAKTYQNQVIPQNLKVTELIERYITGLVSTERINLEDLQFLEQKLVPLLFEDNFYRNALTLSEINSASGDLFNEIFSEQVLSDGRKVNQSFTNLLDSEILSKEGEGSEQKIIFKYERFYEYFLGKKIWEHSNTFIPTQYTFFQEKIEATNDFPFLWGAVRNALVYELKENGTDIVLRLCFTEKQRIKEMAVSVLTEYGKDHDTDVGSILEILILEKTQKTYFKKIRSLSFNPKSITNLCIQNGQKIAVEVASNLQIPWILQAGLLHSNPTIRTAAVRYTYYLWRLNQELGFKILENLIQYITNYAIFPNFRAIESIVGLSSLIFFYHYKDPLNSKKLQSVWKEIIFKIFHIKETSNIRGVSNKFLRKRIFWFIFTIIFKLLHESRVQGNVDYQRLISFFKLKASYKKLYKKLTHYIDVTHDYVSEEFESDLLSVIEVNDLLIWTVTLMGLSAHTMNASISLLPFLRKFFEQAQSFPSPNPYLIIVPQVLLSVLDHNPMNEEYFRFFEHTASECQQYFSFNKPPGWEHFFNAPNASHVCPYVFQYYKRTGTIRSVWLESRIESAILHKDIAFFDKLLRVELPFVGLGLHSPQIALETVGLFITVQNDEIMQLIQIFLARLRTIYPDEVDNFLEIHNIPSEFRIAIQTNEPVETIGEVIGYRSWNFIRDEMIGGDSSIMRGLLVDVLEKAADCKNMKEWVYYVINKLINTICDSEVL